MNSQQLKNYRRMTTDKFFLPNNNYVLSLEAQLKPKIFIIGFPKSKITAIIGIP